MASRKGWLRRVAGEFVRRLKEHDLMMMAAAISFYWLLGTIPLLLLGTSAIGYFSGSSDRATEEVLAATRRMIPRATGREVQDFLRTVIQSRHVTGGIGIVFLLWFAAGAFEMVASALSAVCGERDTRSFLHRKLVALGMMCSVGLLLVLALLGSWLLTAWPEVESLLGIHLALPAFLADRRLPYYLPSILLGAALAVVYRIAPARPIGWPAALAGGTLAAVLWHQVKVLFNWYLVHYSRINLFFGILGGFVMLILWVFYTAVILLLGGMLADILDRGGRQPRSQS
jgi:membrane protein